MDLSILLKYKEIGMEGGITGLLEVTAEGGFLMKIYASIELFGFKMAVLIGSTIGPIDLNKFTMNAL